MANNQKIRIRLKAYDHQVLDQSAEKIVDTAKEPEHRFQVRCRFRHKGDCDNTEGAAQV
jgi:ribosomal protein S10